MSPNAKFIISNIVSVVSLGLMVLGLRTMIITKSSHGFTGIGLVFCGACIGIFAGVAAQYYGIRKQERPDADKIAVETLAKLAEAEEYPVAKKKN